MAVDLLMLIMLKELTSPEPAEVDHLCHCHYLSMLFNQVAAGSSGSKSSLLVAVEGLGGAAGSLAGSLLSYL